MENTKKTGIRALAWVLAFALVALSIPLFTIVPNVTASADTMVKQWHTTNGVSEVYFSGQHNYIYMREYKGNVAGETGAGASQDWVTFATSIQNLSADQYVEFVYTGNFVGITLDNTSISLTTLWSQNPKLTVTSVNESEIRCQISGPLTPGSNSYEVTAYIKNLTSMSSTQNTQLAVTVYQKGGGESSSSESGSSTTEPTADEPSGAPDWQLIWSGTIDKNFTSDGNTGILSYPELNEALANEMETNGVSEKYKLTSSGCSYLYGGQRYAYWLLRISGHDYPPSPSPSSVADTDLVFPVNDFATAQNTSCNLAYSGDGGSVTIHVGTISIYAWRTAATEPEEPEPEEPTVTNLIVNGDFSDNLNGWTFSKDYYKNNVTVDNGVLTIAEHSFDPDLEITASLIQGYQIKPKTNYTLRFNMTTSNSANLFVKVCRGGDYRTENFYSTSGTYTFETTEGATNNNFKVFIFGSKNGGELSGTFDNFVLVEGTSIPEPSESETEPTTRPTEVVPPPPGDNVIASWSTQDVTIGGGWAHLNNDSIAGTPGTWGTFKNAAKTELTDNRYVEIVVDGNFNPQQGSFSLRDTLWENNVVNSPVSVNNSQIVYRIDGPKNNGTEASQLGFNLINGVVTGNVNITITIYEKGGGEMPDEVKDAKYSASLTLNENIDIKLKISNLSTNYDPNKLKVYVNKYSIAADALTFPDETTVIVPIASVQPDKMADDLEIAVAYGDVTVKPITYSIRKYCESVFNAYKDTPTDPLYKLCEAVLNYGAATAVYTNADNANKNVNAGYVINFSDANYIPESKLKLVGNHITAATCNLTLKSTITMNINVTLPAGKTINTTNPTDPEQDGTFVILSSNNTLVDKKNIGVTNNGGNNYTISITNITSSKLDREYTLMFWDDVKNAKDLDSVASSLTFGVYNYCYEAQGQTGEEFTSALKTLCKAIYNYGRAAKTYHPD